MKQATGTWWRYDRYEVRDGYIRPAPNASLSQFDPWRAYWQREGHVNYPPYLQLVELVRDVPTDRSWRGIAVSAELQSDVLDWCRRYGLLGLLPHDLLLARLGSWQVIRAGGHWEKSYFPWEPWEPDEPVGPWGEVILSSDGEAEHIDSEGWWRYFPDLRPNDQFDEARRAPQGCLVPLSDEFWEHYGEEFESFVLVARHLADAVEVISDQKGRSVTEYGGKPLDKQGALERLNQLSSGINLTVSTNRRGRYTQGWDSPSLLGHLAMQAVQDLLGGRIVTCPCGETFSTRHPGARFHDEKCADKYRQREWRERKRKRAKRRPGSAASR